MAEHYEQPIGQESYNHEGEQQSHHQQEDGKDDSNGRKLFIGGLNWNTSDETLGKYFGKYGEVTDSIIMRFNGPHSDKQSRGFGFITYKDASTAEKVVNLALELDGRRLEVKMAIPKGTEGLKPHSVAPQRTKKIFVGGLDLKTSTEAFRSHFNEFGTVVDAQIMLDHKDNQSRGFGFITFSTEDATEMVFAAGPQIIEGKTTEIRRAIPKTPGFERGGFSGGRGGRGGFSGGRGGYGGPEGGYGGGYGGYGASSRGGYDSERGSGYAGRGGRGGRGGYGTGSPYGSSAGGGWVNPRGGGAAGAYGSSYGGGGGGGGGYGAGYGSSSGYGGYGSSAGYGAGYGASSGAAYGAGYGATGYGASGYGYDTAGVGGGYSAQGYGAYDAASVSGGGYGAGAGAGLSAAGGVGGGYGASGVTGGYGSGALASGPTGAYDAYGASVGDVSGYGAVRAPGRERTTAYHPYSR